MIDCAFEFRVLYIRLFVQLFLNNVVPFGLNDKIVFHSYPKIAHLLYYCRKVETRVSS